MNAIRMFHRVSGNGPAMVIMHGLFGSSDNWLSLVKWLNDQYTVYLVDARNHGQSPHTSIHNYASMAEDLLFFLNDNQIEKPILIGHSMGGKAMMHFALTYPDRFDRLVVVDISPKYYAPHHQIILEGLHAIDVTSLNSRNEADIILSEHIPEIDIRQFLLKNLYRNEEGKFGWRMHLDLLTEQIESIGEAAPEGKVCTKPTLFIKGAYSNYIKGGDETLIHTFFPNAQIEVVEAGHWVQAENPSAFVKTLLSFLQNEN